MEVGQLLEELREKSATTLQHAEKVQLFVAVLSSDVHRQLLDAVVDQAKGNHDRIQAVLVVYGEAEFLFVVFGVIVYVNRFQSVLAESRDDVLDVGHLIFL